MPLYSYPFNKSILVTDETTKLTPYTFSSTGIWEYKEIEYFYNKVFGVKKEKLVIVDIGAQTGLYTLFAKFVDNATFYSFEPFIPSYNALNENIKLNGISNVKTFNTALSYKKETKHLRVPSHKGLCTLGDNPKRFDEYENVEVQCDTLDNIFFNNNIPVDFIKCDTEGWEYYVLKGGIQTINKYKPVIQLEYVPINMQQCNVTPDMFNQLISELGYVNTHSSGEEFIFEPANTCV